MQDSDIQKLKDALLPELQQTLKTEVQVSHSTLSNQIDRIGIQMDNLKLQVEPIAEVYDTINGGGTLIGWIFQKVIIPLSVVIGILLALHNLKK